jgi:hypothetical protein
MFTVSIGIGIPRAGILFQTTVNTELDLIIIVFTRSQLAYLLDMTSRLANTNKLKDR